MSEVEEILVSNTILEKHGLSIMWSGKAKR